jgi:hypothetical protein
MPPAILAGRMPRAEYSGFAPLQAVRGDFFAYEASKPELFLITFIACVHRSTWTDQGAGAEGRYLNKVGNRET